MQKTKGEILDLLEIVSLIAFFGIAMIAAIISPLKPKEAVTETKVELEAKESALTILLEEKREQKLILDYETCRIIVIFFSSLFFLTYMIALYRVPGLLEFVIKELDSPTQHHWGVW